MNKESLFNLWKNNNFIKPVLFIGRCADIISSNLEVYTYEDIFNSNINISNPVFDITNLSLDNISYILDSFNNVVLISYKEKIIDSNLLSKINLIIKDSNTNYSELLDAKEASDMLKTNKIKDFDKFYSENSPELYYLKNKTRKVNSSSKYIELLSKN